MNTIHKLHRFQIAAALCIGLVSWLGCGASSPETETPAELNPSVRSAQSEGEGPDQAACEQGILKDSWQDCEPSDFTFDNRCFSSSELACRCAGCPAECLLLESAPVQVRCSGGGG